MNFSKKIADHLQQVYFGGNWTAANLQETVKDITWEQATRKIENFNSILALVFHIHYYVSATLPVLKGKPLNAHDKFAFDHPKINSESEWQAYLSDIWKEAEEFISLIELLPDEKLDAFLAEEKYGTYYRNLQGIIEHSHYHLGQISLLKKML